MSEQIKTPDEFEDFVLQEFVRIGQALRSMREELAAMQDANAAVLSAAEEKLEAVSLVRRSLDGAERGPVKLIHRNAAGDLQAIEEFLPGRS